MTDDIRWVQRFDSYKKALAALERTVAITAERPLSEAEQQGLIQAFEFTHELAWNLLKDFLEEKGFKDFHGSKDSTRIAFHEGLLDEGEIWMEMIKSRNETSHTYNIETANEIAALILNSYIGEYRRLAITMNKYLEEI
jgi:nucleotidyltransferase substrate binding protein (TIGR01987 family)